MHQHDISTFRALTFSQELQQKSMVKCKMKLIKIDHTRDSSSSLPASSGSCCSIISRLIFWLKGWNLCPPKHLMTLHLAIRDFFFHVLIQLSFSFEKCNFHYQTFDVRVALTFMFRFTITFSPLTTSSSHAFADNIELTHPWTASRSARETSTTKEKGKKLEARVS